MADTIIAVIVGGAIALIPGLATAIVDYIKHKHQQKHALELRYFDLYSQSRLEVIEAYAQRLTCFITQNYENRHDAWSEYMAAYERVSLFVSRDTRELMRSAFDKLIPYNSGLRSEYDFAEKALKAHEYHDLLSALQKDLFSSLSSK